jgi:hypothetical protein
MSTRWSHQPPTSARQKLNNELRKLNFNNAGVKMQGTRTTMQGTRTRSRQLNSETGVHTRASSRVATPSSSPSRSPATAGKRQQKPSNQVVKAKKRVKAPADRAKAAADRAKAAADLGHARDVVNVVTRAADETVVPSKVRKRKGTNKRRGEDTPLYSYLKQQVRTKNERYDKCDSEKKRMASFAAKLRWNIDEAGPTLSNGSACVDHHKFYLAVTYQRLSGLGGGGSGTQRSTGTTNATYLCYESTMEMHLWMSVIWPLDKRPGDLGVNEYKALYKDGNRAGARVPPRTLMTYREQWLQHGFQLKTKRPGNPTTRKLDDKVEDFLLCAIIMGVKRNDPLSAHDCMDFARNYGGGDGDVLSRTLKAKSLRTWFTGFKKRVHLQTGISIKKLKRVTQMSTARQTIMFVDLARRPTDSHVNPYYRAVFVRSAVFVRIFFSKLCEFMRDFDCAGHVSNADQPAAERPSRLEQSRSNRELGRELLRHK